MRTRSNPDKYRLTAMTGDRSKHHDIPGGVWRALVACQQAAGEDVIYNPIFDVNRPGAAKFLAALEKGLRVPASLPTPRFPQFVKAGSQPAPRPARKSDSMARVTGSSPSSSRRAASRPRGRRTCSAPPRARKRWLSCARSSRSNVV